jgi:hypothetical protein
MGRSSKSARFLINDLKSVKITLQKRYVFYSYVFISIEALAFRKQL